MPSRSKNNLLEKIRDEIEWYFKIKPGRLMSIFMKTSSIINISVSILVFILFVQPMAYFNGFPINGYISPLKYELSIAGSVTKYSILESICIISWLILVFNVFSFLMSVLSFLSTRLLTRNWISLIPLTCYSNTLILTLTYSVMRVLAVDIIPILSLTVRFNMSTNVLKLNKIEIYYSWTYSLLKKPYFFLATTIILIIIGTLTLTYLLIKPSEPVVSKHVVKSRRNRKIKTIGSITILTILFIIILLTPYIYTSLFSYKYGFLKTYVSQPIIWLEDYGNPNTIVQLYNLNTLAYITVNVLSPRMRILERLGYSFDLRNQSIVNDYFTPITTQGCEYYVSPDGTGIIVTGNPAGGLYRGCGLRYVNSIVTKNYSATFIMKTSDTTPVDGIRGLIIIETSSGYYYLVGIKNNSTGWFFGIYEYRGGAIREPGGPVLPSIADIRIETVVDKWVIISFNMVYLDETVYLKAWLYNYSTGLLITSIEKQVSNPLNIDSFGIGVYQIRGRPSAVFQMIGFTTHYVVTVRGLKYCCHVYIYDTAGQLVGENHVYENGSAIIELRNSALINASVKVICQDREYYVMFDVVLGGDVYEIYMFFEGTVLEIHKNSDSTIRGLISLLNITCDGCIQSIEIILSNTTYTSRVNVEIKGYNGNIIILHSETEELIFNTTSDSKIGYISLRIVSYIYTNCTLSFLFKYYYNIGATGGLKVIVNFTT
ncbi:MAG: hypothetical protein QXU89_01675 [Desulfurococcaceae archaeon]